LDDYRAELRRVEERQVKFAGRWMSPAARDEAYRQLARVAQHQRLARLEAEHDQLAKGLEEARGSLNATEAALANLPDIVVPIVEYRLVTVPATDWRFVPWVEYEPWVVGEQVYPNPKRPELASNQRFYAKQIADGEARLAQLREQIAGLRDQLTDPAARQ
jgi:hypothetical protein